MTSSAAMNIQFYIDRIYISLGIFAVICAQIYRSNMEIWKKMWVGVFFWTQCSCQLVANFFTILIALLVIFSFI